MAGPKICWHSLARKHANELRDLTGRQCVCHNCIEKQIAILRRYRHEGETLSDTLRRLAGEE